MPCERGRHCQRKERDDSGNQVLGPRRQYAREQVDTDLAIFAARYETTGQRDPEHEYLQQLVGPDEPEIEGITQQDLPGGYQAQRDEQRYEQPVLEKPDVAAQPRENTQGVAPETATPFVLRYSC